MSGGGDDSSPNLQPLPDMPPEAELMDALDKINGVQAVTVTGADGKQRRVVERLPRTQEEQRLYDMFGNTVKNSFEKMNDLIKYDHTAVPSFQPFLNTINEVNQQRSADMRNLVGNLPDFNAYVENFINTSNQITNDTFDKYDRETQESLNRAGYANSTGAAEARAASAAQRSQQLNTNNVNAINAGTQLRNNEYEGRGKLYQLRDLERQGNLQGSAMQNALTENEFNQFNDLRQQMLDNQGKVLNIADTAINRDKQQAAGSIAPVLANDIYNSMNNVRTGRYTAQSGAVNQANANEIERYKVEQANQSPSFGDMMLNLGMQGLGAYGGSYLGGLGQKHSGVGGIGGIGGNGGGGEWKTISGVSVPKDANGLTRRAKPTYY